ncbi:MAG: hypothetical protein K2W82_10250 [Candidatus Obscuribacterales bacterium]|nr:hypothetical protein [Candidatus Obscuribacterales bacterium]
MNFKINRQDIIDGTIELHSSNWGGRASANLDGKQLERAREKGWPFIVPGKKGKSHKLYVRAHFLDPVPAVTLDQQEILLAEKLRIVDCFFAVLPIGMFIGHGPLPTLLGYFVVSANFKILRSKWMPTLKWAAIYALSIAVFGLTTMLSKLIWNTR